MRRYRLFLVDVLSGIHRGRAIWKSQGIYDARRIGRRIAAGVPANYGAATTHVGEDFRTYRRRSVAIQLSSQVTPPSAE